MDFLLAQKRSWRTLPTFSCLDALPTPSIDQYSTEDLASSASEESENAFSVAVGANGVHEHLHSVVITL